MFLANFPRRIPKFNVSRKSFESVSLPMFSNSEWPPPKILGGVHLTKVLITKSKSTGFGSDARKNDSLFCTIKAYWAQQYMRFHHCWATLPKTFFSETVSLRISFLNNFYSIELTQSVYAVTLIITEGRVCSHIR